MLTKRKMTPETGNHELGKSLLNFAERMIEVIEIKLDFKLRNLENLDRRNVKNIIECKKNLKYTRARLNIKERSRSQSINIEKQDSRFFKKMTRRSKSPIETSKKKNNF